MKKNIDKFKKQNDGKDYDQAKRQTGRALRKAGSAFFARNQDKERVDTGQMGMGTALRKMGSQGQTTLRALAGAEPEQKGQKKDPRKTLAGKAAAGGFRRIQKRLFNVEPTPRTGRGRPITGDADVKDTPDKKAQRKSLRRPDPGDTPQETAAKNDPMSDKIQQEIERETGRRTRNTTCLLYTSPSPRDRQKSRMPSSA